MNNRTINMFMNRPDWVTQEGYWRILVIVRFLLFVPIMLWAGACIYFGFEAGKPSEGIAYCVMGVLLAFCTIFVFNFLVRLVGWVVLGFR